MGTAPFKMESASWFLLIFLLAYLLAARIFGTTRKGVPMESGERLSAQTAGEATKDEVMRKI